MIYSLAITGPTASGKTSISIELAKLLTAEIISCDSMQIYKEMDIGTAKATAEERAAVPHHLIDFLSPKEDFSAEEYRKMALAVAGNISARGRIPMFVGGTGLYIDTVMRPSQTEVPESSREYRDRIMESIKNDDDVLCLWQRLLAVDPESAEAIHKNNVRRVIRALEIYDATGKPKSYFDKLSRLGSSEISVGMITLDFHNRENLYQRVDTRVDMMIKDGLLREVEGLFNDGLLCPDTTASQAIGYKELVGVLEGKKSLDVAIEEIKQFSRNYAKRQLTWFRHTEDAINVFVDTEDKGIRKKQDVLKECIDIFSSALKKINT